MIALKNRKLPKKVFVYWEPDGEDGAFLLVQEDLLTAVENAGEAFLIGAYNLEKIVTDL